MRVGYYPETPEIFWINHDKIRWRPLQDVIEDILKFMSLSDDPLIIDFHRTPVGFEDSKTLNLFTDYINDQLGGLGFPSDSSFKTSLNDIWNDGRKLIISFADNNYEIRNKYLWIWPSISQYWADAKTQGELKDYIDRKMRHMKKRKELWAAMGHMSPTLWDIMTNKGKSLREMADKTGGSLTIWLKEDWVDSANILTSDFFHSNDIIDTSIRLVKTF